MDVHEVHALKYSDTSFVSSIFNWLYCHCIHRIIYHSKRNFELLRDSKATKIYVPHLKYTFQKTYEKDKVSDEISSCFHLPKPKFLFFGNLSRVKGVDVVIDTFSFLQDRYDFELVVAGKNVDNMDFSSIIKDKIRIFSRHINDDELVYLYSHTDYVLLPYRKSSQSGIFAMAAYFHKPMILSDISYFKIMIEKYPSFGFVSSISSFTKVIEDIFTMKRKRNYYRKEDCDRFEMKEEIDRFVSQIIGIEDCL